MRRTYECGTKARLSLSGGPHTPVIMADGMEANVGGENYGKWQVCCAVLRYIFRTSSFRKSLKFFGTSIASLDPETVDLPAFYILFVTFTGACGPPEKLSLALAPRSIVLHTIVKLTY